jgi:hypothetical protein
MAYYDYKYLSSQNVSFGWYDITASIQRPLALGLSQNITEYWINELVNYNLQFKIDSDVDALLHWAEKNNSRLIAINAIGTSLSLDTSFINTLSEYLQTVDIDDITVIGHILDKNDRFYELHHQSFIVNVEWWVAAGRPKVGFESNNTITLPDVDRSVENWHDGYTPHWIEHSGNSRSYSGTKFGWNILNHALNSKKRIYSFTKELRLSKCFLYPDVRGDFHNKIIYMFNAIQSYSHFIANTENPPYIPWDRLGFDSFDGAACTAGGLSPILTAWAAKLKPGDTLVIMDVSPLALIFQKKLISRTINLDNINDAIHGVIKDFDPDYSHIRSVLRADSNIKRMQEVISELNSQGLKDYYENVFNTLNIKYVEANALVPSTINGAISNFNNSKHVYINLSNVYHYQNTSWLYSLTDRYDLEKQLIYSLAKNSHHKYYLKNIRHQGGSWNCISADDILSNEQYLSVPDFIKEIPWIKQ